MSITRTFISKVKGEGTLGGEGLGGEQGLVDENAAGYYQHAVGLGLVDYFYLIFRNGLRLPSEKG
jgi:hypothetical protein